MLPTLRSFPNAAIGIALGLGGNAILWKTLRGWALLNSVAITLEAIQWVMFLSCALCFLAFLITYAIKTMRHPDVVLGEIRHPVRNNFFCGPCIALCMLTLALPPSLNCSAETLQVLWTISFVYQCSSSMILYHGRLFRRSASDNASAPDLLSIVSWFLLCVIGTPAEIDLASGLPLRAMCFGIGTFFSAFLYPFILLGIYAGRTPKGTPALFLMVAPPSVAGVGLIGLNGGVGPGSDAIFGVVLFLELLFLRSSPNILARPQVLGVYWAYVFPNAAVAILSINIAKKYQTTACDAMALSLSAIAMTALIVVFGRMSLHMAQVCRGLDVWSDPIVLAMDANAAAAAKEEEEGQTESRTSKVHEVSGGDGSCGNEIGGTPSTVRQVSHDEILEKLGVLEKMFATSAVV